MSFDLLSEPIRRYVRDKKWESLRPIQNAAITKIITTDCNYILASRTASGKTEAAFLPILSKVNFNEFGVQVLYISPLIALINDQFFRIEELCKYLDVDVTKWHGDASRTSKNKLIKNPRGIVLITPESLEAMFVNAPYNIKNIFSNLKYIVIDEIHAFIGTDRGIQLKSILSRIQQVNKNTLRIIGLSATIGDYNEAKKMTGNPANTKVLLDRSTKEMDTLFKYFNSTTPELPLELIKDMYKSTRNNKVLIFPNSRGRAEEISVKLKKISEKVNGHPYYFSHHSSIDKALREYVENFAKTNQRNSFCISCTSTLELGIDIGTVDKVVQVDATHSISSLIQRVGRSGRGDGDRSSLLLYATNNWSLLQSLACWLLYLEGYIEPIVSLVNAYDILLHQILSVVKQHSGIGRSILITEMQNNFAFQSIDKKIIEDIIDELIRIDFLEPIENDLIIGVEGEKIVNSRNFYSVFIAEPALKVINNSKPIGEVPFSPQIKVDENILLAAKMWKIVAIDLNSNRIEVIQASDGKKPLFFGSSGDIDSKIREKMFEILFSKQTYQELDSSSAKCLEVFREEFSKFPIIDIEYERPIFEKNNKTIFYSFQGSKINRSLNYLISKAGYHNVYDDQSTEFEIDISISHLDSLVLFLIHNIDKMKAFLFQDITDNPSLIEFSKWGKYLPINYQVELLSLKYFDFNSTLKFLMSLKFISIPKVIKTLNSNKIF